MKKNNGKFITLTAADLAKGAALPPHNPDDFFVLPLSLIPDGACCGKINRREQRWLDALAKVGRERA